MKQNTNIMIQGQVTFTEGNYGFGFDWNLIVTNDEGKRKNFYLGQDSKFCNRVLGMTPRYVVEQIGDNDLRNVDVQKKLGNFIIETLGLTEEQVFNLETWELCCQ